jgi:TATA-binding protein-associated factor
LSLNLRSCTPSNDNYVYECTWNFLQQSSQLLTSLSHAPKLRALRDILRECGIGSAAAAAFADEDEDGDPAAADVAAAAAAGAKQKKRKGAKEDEEEDGGGEDGEGEGGGHRVLIFCQLKPLLDLVQRLVMEPMGVSYLRIDGGVEASQRFQIVQK